jgi:uncharacterized membrane protein YhaH (DUF805 family)
MPDPGGCFAWALLPLRRYAEFGGRSRRTELVAFYLLLMLVGFPLTFAMLMLRSFEIVIAAGWLLQLALLCPSVALAVRRLHDSGRSGWWLLLAVPGVALSIWQTFHPEAALGPEDMLSLVDLADSAASLVLLVLLLWTDDPEPNRYGPNPRYDPPELAEPEAQGLA